jgi:hypothetical protein
VFAGEGAGLTSAKCKPLVGSSSTIAALRLLSESTSGRAWVGMNDCTKVLYVSLISRCDSAGDGAEDQ